MDEILRRVNKFNFIKNTLMILFSNPNSLLKTYVKMNFSFKFVYWNKNFSSIPTRHTQAQTKKIINEKCDTPCSQMFVYKWKTP